MKSHLTKYRNDDSGREFFGREAPVKFLRLGLAIFSLFAASLALPQSNSAAPLDAIAILQQVGQRYTDAKSYQHPSHQRVHHYERLSTQLAQNHTQCRGGPW